MNVTNSTANRPAEQMAIGLSQDAEIYLDAASRVHQGDEQAIPRYMPPTYFLFCHAIELLLKAFLASHGTDERGLRKFGHDLNAAFAAATERGFSPADDRFPELVEWLAPYHEDHIFRYRQPGLARLPLPSETATILQPVIASVKATVRARYMASRQGAGTESQ